jgi:hypothetical protein
MTFEIIDPKEFMTDGVLFEDAFLAAAGQFDWSKYQGKKVLVRGCGSTIIPPWVYMYITARLAGVAKSVRYGNEHDHIVVCRSKED